MYGRALQKIFDKYEKDFNYSNTIDMLHNYQCTAFGAFRYYTTARVFP
ncbi:hypothetical protein BD94_0497 [Elizabethkingia anophelis NUHP1]|uniref:Uncharacterized protein n=2 Tax=Elizabethkingia anophelis TaxID=1117645 RepID=A0A455ZBG4_9FLAO|nr:hypothetical protein BD94_0497 [Elizabethkingia anophelis NUHP1]DAC74200.1 TPA_exp: hypothetical protein [Elizabethkingia anophelis]DAC74293.1 TPA_exp: hypothetical protein [Elizabethkingia anophelis]DAC74324.1 TPA_exp: hypothetical protein [Elizabethkingia anophelis]DAC74417.1 TPA_exp: hypothetical protein [Elizabethkingia anophelis]